MEGAAPLEALDVQRAAHDEHESGEREGSDRTRRRCRRGAASEDEETPRLGSECPRLGHACLVEQVEGHRPPLRANGATQPEMRRMRAVTEERNAAQSHLTDNLPSHATSRLTEAPERRLAGTLTRRVGRSVGDDGRQWTREHTRSTSYVPSWRHGTRGAVCTQESCGLCNGRMLCNGRKSKRGRVFLGWRRRLDGADAQALGTP